AIIGRASGLDFQQRCVHEHDKKATVARNSDFLASVSQEAMRKGVVHDNGAPCRNSARNRAMAMKLVSSHCLSVIPSPPCNPRSLLIASRLMSSIPSSRAIMAATVDLPEKASPHMA